MTTVHADASWGQQPVAVRHVTHSLTEARTQAVSHGSAALVLVTVVGFYTTRLAAERDRAQREAALTQGAPGRAELLVLLLRGTGGAMAHRPGERGCPAVP